MEINRNPSPEEGQTMTTRNRPTCPKCLAADRISPMSPGKLADCTAWRCRACGNRFETTDRERASR